MINGKASEEFAASTSEFLTKSYIIILNANRALNLKVKDVALAFQ